MASDKQRYTIVRFPEEGGILDLVPVCWLQEKNNEVFCSYPDTHDYCHLDDWLAQLKEPESNWKLYIVEIISYAKSLQQGRRRLARAMKLSENVESEARGPKPTLNQTIPNQTDLERELYNMQPMSTSECSSKQKGTTSLNLMKDKFGSTGSIRTKTPSLVSATDITTELCLHFDKKLDDALNEITKEITAAKRSILYDINKKMEQMQASIVINTAGAKEVSNTIREMEKSFQMFPLNTLQEFLSLEEDLNTREGKKDALISLFSTKILSERNVKSCINKIMSAVIGKSVQMEYSGTGKPTKGHPKRNFSDTETFHCLENALLEKFANDPELKGLPGKVGRWLSGARDRDGGRKHRVSAIADLEPV